MKEKSFSVFATIYASISLSKSLAQAVSSLRGISGIQIVSVDEINRRIIVRVFRSKYTYVITLLAEYSSSITVEIKSVKKGKNCSFYHSCPRSPKALLLLHRGEKRRLYAKPCSKDYLVLVEVMPRKCLFKLCRKPSTEIREVNDIPPSLCAYNALGSVKSLDLFDVISECVISVENDFSKSCSAN